MPTLNVPTPTLEFEAVAPGLAALEKPVEVRCGAPTFPDGSPFAEDDLGTAGFFVYRQQGPATTELWSEGAKRWEPDPGAAVAGFKTRPLVFSQGGAAPWRGPLVAAGQKDEGHQPQFQPTTADFPRYLFRAYFAASRKGQPFSGLSAPSAPVRFVGLLDAMRAGLGLGDGESPEDATLVRMFLRDANLQFAGLVEIRREGSSAVVEISNREAGSQRAMIRLKSNGDVEVEPAGGRHIVLSGPVLYQPADANGIPVGLKKYLP